MRFVKETNVKKIIRKYFKAWEEKDLKGFSKIVEKENDYNLNGTLYTYPEEEIEEINIAREWKDISDINKKLSETEKKIANYLSELEINDI